MYKPQGCITALVTPMKADFSIDFNALDYLIEYQVAAGIDGIVIAGTTGEATTLTLEEHINLIRHAVKRVDGRVSVIAGTGTNCTRATSKVTQMAAAAGVDACMLVTPYYNRPTQEGMFKHYEYIAEQTDIPLILYNVPSRTNVSLSIETIQRLSKIENIVGIKEASGDQIFIRNIINNTDKGFHLVSGDDAQAVQHIADGATGLISVASNIIPEYMRSICYDCCHNQYEKAFKFHTALQPFFSSLFTETNPIPIKYLLSKIGLIKNIIRLPLTPLSEEYQEKIMSGYIQYSTTKISNTDKWRLPSSY